MQKFVLIIGETILQKLETELKIRGFSDKTIKSYIFHNQKFLDFAKKSPEQIEEDDVKRYLGYLISDKKQKPSSINLTLSTLRFFYGRVLEKDLFRKVSSVKSEKKIPMVLSKDEIKIILQAAENKKHKMLIELMYSSGLRVSEAVSIKFEDLDLTQKMAKVQSGKGKKDRIVILSSSLAAHIESYQKRMAKKGISSVFLFPSQKNMSHHISIRQAQKAIKIIAKKAGIEKRVFCHAFRSSFATHLLEDGVDIRYIQALLGHSSIATTQIYTKVSTEQLKKIRSPLDKL